MGDEGESNLEMRCSADEAWYDGTLRISEESKDLIVVHFNDFDEEEDETFHRSDLRDPAKLRSRVRVRSVQLQDSQCRRVYENQKICGCLEDDDDRKYYDCEVTAIAKRTHAFKDDGEECLCRFTVFWLDGPKKREMTVIGCGDVCFLSLEHPEDDPMVKNLVKSLPGNGDQPRRKLVKNGTKTAPKSAPPKSVAPPKPVVLPRPRTPSPSLELAPSKKQPSREPSPPVEAPTQTVPELARTKSLPIGSKKKRIMQAAGQAANNNGKVESSAPKDQSSHRPAAEGDENVAAGHGNESVPAERRVLRGALQASEKKRVVKGKAKQAAAPEVTNHDEAPKEKEDTAPRPTGPVKKRLKAAEGDEDVATGHGDESVAVERRVLRGALQSGEKKRIMRGKAKEAAAPVVTNHDEAPKEKEDTTPRQTGPVKKRMKLTSKSKMNTVTSETVVVTQSLAERVKLKKAQRSPDAAATPEAAAPAAASSPATESAKQPDNIVQSLGERVKLKTAQKNPSSGTSPAVDAHKDSLQKIGKQVVRKQVTKRKLIQLQDLPPDTLRSKFDKVVKPKSVPSKPKEPVAAQSPEPPKVADPEPPPPSPSTAVPETGQPKTQKRKAGRPRKNPPNPPKNQTSSAQRHNPPEENTLTRSNLRGSKKRPRDEEEQPEEQPEPSRHEEEQPRDEEEEQQNEEEQPHDEEEQPHDEEEQPHDEEEQPHDEEEHPREEEEQPREEEEQPREEEEQLRQEEEQPREEEEQLRQEEEQPREEEEQPREEEEEQSHHDTISESRGAPASTGKRKKLLIIGDLNEEAPLNDDDEPEVEAETNVNAYMENKVSIAEKFRDIQNKYHNIVTVVGDGDSRLSSPQAAMELISMAGGKDDDNSETETDEDRVTMMAPVAHRKADEWAALDAEERTRGRVLVVENMEVDTSAFDAIQLLAAHTDGVCAVHILPVLEFQVTATAYALFRDAECAFKALRWLTSMTRFVVSPNGRPWIVSQAKEVYGPRLCGFAAHTAFKSDDRGMCGLISDQPHVYDLVVVTQRDNNAFYKAQQMCKVYEEQKKWRKELYDRIVQHNMKG